MDNKIYLVKNRSASRVVYRIPEEGIRREFGPGEVKQLSFAELEKLSYQPGGVAMMANFLQIQNIDAVQNLGIRTEPEYHMTEAQIVDLIKTGSLDAFLDCLDFAPVGVVDLLKKFAISVPLEDYEKRKALKEKTGLDVDAALKNIAAEKADEGKQTTTNTRRIQPIVEETSTGRRTSGANYKVVTKQADKAAE